MPQKSDQSDNVPVSLNTIQPAKPITSDDQPKTDIPKQKVSTPSPNSSDQNPGSQVPQKYGGRKIIATIFGIGILMIGLASTIFLIQRRELRTGQAANCSAYTFTVTEDGTVTVQNGSSQNWETQKVDVFVNGLLVETYDVPTLSRGSASTLGTVRVPMYDGFTWKVEGRSECKNSGKFEARTN